MIKMEMAKKRERNVKYNTAQYYIILYKLHKKNRPESLYFLEDT
jgi:hypothetical protein